MSTLEDLDDLERENRDKKQDQGDDGKKPGGDDDAEMEDAEKKEDEEELLDEEILHSSTADIVKRRRMLENEMRIMKSEFQRLTHEQSTMREKVKDNQEKIENNRYCPNYCPGERILADHPRPQHQLLSAGALKAAQSIELSFWFVTDVLGVSFQATTIPRRKRRRAPGSRRGGRSCRGRGQHRSGRYPRWQIRRHQDLNSPDHFPSTYRFG